MRLQLMISLALANETQSKRANSEAARRALEPARAAEFRFKMVPRNYACLRLVMSLLLFAQIQLMEAKTGAGVERRSVAGPAAADHLIMRRSRSAPIKSLPNTFGGSRRSDVPPDGGLDDEDEDVAAHLRGPILSDMGADHTNNSSSGVSSNDNASGRDGGDAPRSSSSSDAAIVPMSPDKTPNASGLAELNPDASDTVPEYMQHMTVVLVTLHLSVFITGLVGNSLVCLSVYRNKSLQTVTNYYIVNLAVADFLVILICLPPTVYWDLNLTWNFGLVPCKLVLYLQSTSVSVSVLTLTCISFDRWYAICKPLEFCSTKSRAKKAIALIWFVSMIIASPDVIFLTTRPLYEEDGYVYMDCTYSWPEENTKIYQLCIVTLLFVFPFVLMIISYSHIVNVLWRNETMTETMGHTMQANLAGRKASKFRRFLSTSVHFTTTTTNCTMQDNQQTVGRYRNGNNDATITTTSTVAATAANSNKSINYLSQLHCERTGTGRKSWLNGNDNLERKNRNARSPIRLLDHSNEDSSYRSDDSSLDRQSSWREIKQLNRGWTPDEPPAGQSKTILNNIGSGSAGKSVKAKFAEPIIARPEFDCDDHDCRLAGQANCNRSKAASATDGPGKKSEPSKPMFSLQDDDIVASLINGGRHNSGAEGRLSAPGPDTLPVNCFRNGASCTTSKAGRHLVASNRVKGVGLAKCASVGSVWRRCFNSPPAARGLNRQRARGAAPPLSLVVPRIRVKRSSESRDDEIGDQQLASRPINCSSSVSTPCPLPQPRERGSSFPKACGNESQVSRSRPFEKEVDAHESDLVEPLGSTIVKSSRRLNFVKRAQELQYSPAKTSSSSARLTPNARGLPGGCLESISEERSKPRVDENQTMADQTENIPSRGYSKISTDIRIHNQRRRHHRCRCRTEAGGGSEVSAENLVIRISSAPSSSEKLTVETPGIRVGRTKRDEGARDKREADKSDLKKRDGLPSGIMITEEWRRLKLESDKKYASRRSSANCRRRFPDRRVCGITKLSSETSETTFSSRLDDRGVVLVDGFKSDNRSKGARKRRRRKKSGRHGGNCCAQNCDANRLVKGPVHRTTAMTTTTGSPNELFESEVEVGCREQAAAKRISDCDSIAEHAYILGRESNSKHQTYQSRTYESGENSDEGWKSMILVKTKQTMSLSERLDGLDCCQSCFMGTSTSKIRVDQPDQQPNYKLFVGTKSGTSCLVSEDGERGGLQSRAPRSRRTNDVDELKRRLSESQIQSKISARKRSVCLFLSEVERKTVNDGKVSSDVLTRALVSTEITANESDQTSAIGTRTRCSLKHPNDHIEDDEEDDDNCANDSIDHTDISPSSTRYASSCVPSSSDARFCKLIESRKKAAKMLIVIVIMFGLCYLPIHFLNTLRYTTGLPQNNLTTIASLVSHWLCYFNSAVNPLIYNLMSGKITR